jgi:predicted RNase H-like nuclease (RuvC/YqgF family)
LVSDSERPDVAAFRELEQLIRALGDEMAAWRRRAHEAEARLKELTAAAERAAPPASDQAVTNEQAMQLERENQELRQRLESARQRTKQLVERMRFLRQQHELGAER